MTYLRVAYQYNQAVDPSDKVGLERWKSRLTIANIVVIILIIINTAVWIAWFARGTGYDPIYWVAVYYTAFLVFAFLLAFILTLEKLYYEMKRHPGTLPNKNIFVTLATLLTSFCVSFLIS